MQISPLVYTILKNHLFPTIQNVDEICWVFKTFPTTVAGFAGM